MFGMLLLGVVGGVFFKKGFFGGVGRLVLR